VNYFECAVKQFGYTYHSGADERAKRNRVELFDPARKALLESCALPKIDGADANTLGGKERKQQGSKKSERPDGF
jgi:hypothetical protein